MIFAPLASFDDLLARATVSDKARLRIEAELMAARTKARPVLIEGIPAWVEAIPGEPSRRPYLIVIGLPVTNWPWRSPWARVLEPGITDRPPHLLGDGTLCLWHASRPSISVLYARSRAVVWIRCVEIWRRTGQWPTNEWRER